MWVPRNQVYMTRSESLKSFKEFFKECLTKAITQQRLTPEDEVNMVVGSIGGYWWYSRCASTWRFRGMKWHLPVGNAQPVGMSLHTKRVNGRSDGSCPVEWDVIQK